MDNEWIWAVAILVGGIVGAIILTRVLRRWLTGEARPGAVRDAAPALASLVFSAIVVSCMVAALGIMSPNTLDKLPADVVNYLPKVLVAAVVLILGNVGGTIAAAAITQAMVGATGSSQRQVPMMVRGAIVGAAIIVAADQLGIDTTIVRIAAGALFFSIGLSLALLIGLGGKDVAAEIAAGRSLRRIIGNGDSVSFGSSGPDGTPLEGEIVGVHPTAIEISHNGSSTVLPHSMVAKSVLRVTRQSATDDDAAG